MPYQLRVICHCGTDRHLYKVQADNDQQLTAFVSAAGQDYVDQATKSAECGKMTIEVKKVISTISNASHIERR